jgi:dehydratase
MNRLTRPIGLVAGAGAGALALTAAIALATPASAATTVSTSFDCQARPPIGSPQQLTLPASVQADAPATVTAGQAFEVTLAPDAMTVPAAAGSNTVNNLRNLALKVPVPAGSTYQSATVTGGSNLGGTPTVSHAGNVVTVTVPGPIKGGAMFQLPALHLTLTASGAPDTTIDTHVAGTSYNDPALTFTANVKAGFLSINVPASCFANPSPTFTSTTIQTDPPAPTPTDPPAPTPTDPPAPTPTA